MIIVCYRMFISSLILLGASIVLSFAEDLSSNDALSFKRAPMGFQGMRGKKKDLTSIQHGGLSKRAPMGFQVKFCYSKRKRKKINKSFVCLSTKFFVFNPIRNMFRVCVGKRT